MADLGRDEASEERILGLAMADTPDSRRGGKDAMTDLKMDAIGPAADSSTSRPGLGRAIQRIGTHNFSLLIALLALVAIFGALRPDVFFLLRNIVNIGLAIAILGILAMAQTMVIVSGGLDISVGAIVGLSTMCVALAVRVDRPPTIGILFGVAVRRRWPDSSTA